VVAGMRHVSTRFRPRERQPPQVFPLHPQGVERGIVEVPAASQQVAEVLPALAVQGHHLAVQDRLLDRQLFPDPIAEFLEALQKASLLGQKVTAPGVSRIGSMVGRFRLTRGLTRAAGPRSAAGGPPPRGGASRSRIRLGATRRPRRGQSPPTSR
jgi:hypothetical protein